MAKLLVETDASHKMMINICATTNFYCTIGKDITEISVSVQYTPQGGKFIDFDAFVEYMQELKGRETTRELLTAEIWDYINTQIEPDFLSVSTKNISAKEYTAEVTVFGG
jgi:NADPH-dependent 7-cyano-7-deazaguanine reductase QueF